ncbi:MAG TPA: hypothetical protein VD838_16380 [Anaeromyxobacteraceae bacterium]|nr:hypothetical protein [Anaeromyxobacteraceae bacterium]
MAAPDAPALAVPAGGGEAGADLLGALGDAAVDLLRAKREEIIAEANRRLNVPILSEGTEARLIGAVYDALLEAVDAVI